MGEFAAAKTRRIGFTALWLALIASGCAMHEASRQRERITLSNEPMSTINAGAGQRAVQRIAAPDWLVTPVAGVELTGGLFKNAFDANVGYLLSAYSLDELLYRFRERSGDPAPPGQPRGWETTFLPGSSAGLFLWGSGNTLRWVDHPQLREKMNRVIDEIDRCKKPNGFIMAYHESEMTVSENANYVRSWITQGLIEASIAGNEKALPLARGHQDWFNQCDYLPIAKDLPLGYQGMTPILRMYLSPLGRDRDLDVVQEHYQEDWWLDMLVAGDDKGVWRRDGRQEPRTHLYELTAFEAYLDLYRITGDRRYREAVDNGMKMYRDKWQRVGGSFAMSEFAEYPPRTYYLSERYRCGELCGSVFWIKLNQRCHRLYPNVEDFVNEIEKSIYNVCLANQTDSSGIKYHANLHGKKGPSWAVVTCCEGQGTRLYGALPEFIYSIARDGIYVDLYAPSTIAWSHAGVDVTLEMLTAFPTDNSVRLIVSTPAPVSFALHVRMPSWSAFEVDIRVNERLTATGLPGSYCSIEREWAEGDAVTFELPMTFRVTRYVGAEQIEGRRRYAIEYGPILLAVAGEMDFTAPDVDDCIRIDHNPDEPASWLLSVEGSPMHFAVRGKPGYVYMPYYEIRDETFTCFPILEAKGA